MVLRFDPKQPAESSQYALDFASWLAVVPGDELVGASISVVPNGQLVLLGAIQINGSSVSQEIAGGFSNVDYTLTYTVSTLGGRTTTRQAMLYCGTPPELLPGSLGALAARVLRKLGFSIIANSARPPDGATMTSDEVAVQVLRDLGVPIPEADRPTPLPTVSQSELAARALRSVGVNPAVLPVASLASGVVYTVAELARAVLIKLAVVAPDMQTETADQVEAQNHVAAVHDILVGLDFVTWPITAVPAAVADHYVIMAANLAAPGFGKPASLDAMTAAQAAIRTQALSGTFAQALAEAKIAEAHEALNSAGLVSWPITAVPLGVAEAYVRMAGVLLGPVMHTAQDTQAEAAARAAWDASIGDVKRASVIADAQARVRSDVLSVQAELNAVGSIDWGPDAIPASVADAVISMTAMQTGAQFGRDFDAKLYVGLMERVRRVTMGGAHGQALAEQKIRAVHYSLDARGRTRWTLFDVPEWAEEPYVLMAAVLLGPEIGVQVDPSWQMQAEMDLTRSISLMSQREPVIAAYF